VWHRRRVSLVRVRSTKWDGSLHRDSLAWELGIDQWGTWLAQASGSTVTTASTTYRSAAGLRLFSSDRWWSAFFMTDADNAAIPLVYVDIATPVHRVGATLMFVDLDLDVQKSPGGDVEILDREEFLQHRERYGYPDHLVEVAERSCAEVAALLAAGAEPFANAPRGWLVALADLLCDPASAGQLT